MDADTPQPGLYKKVKLARVAQWLVILAVTIFFMVYYKNVVQPFVLALVVWYLIRQLKTLIGRIQISGKPLPRWLRGTLALLITVVMGFLIVELLAYNVDQIQKKLPEYDQTLDRFLANIPAVDGLEDVSQRIQKRLQTLNLQPIVARFLGSITSAIGNLVLITIYLIFFAD